ncbi:MAG: chitobiase/beta-hexosaminidase C-terminal domain-containing protein [Bacteroidales bacterium]|nr:chitobiase/beta-hexosaminidase C-terminal domain-containing protein [Bacteroidales bacterium]MCF8458254.1 chitobiase/beta-hexosaminidase C-terminal domain-containing protein [Bacteroidales bacterium]
MKRKKLHLLILIGILSCVSFAMAHSQITLPSIFADNMVLQQNFEAPIWGWAKPGTEISVSGNWSRMPAQSTIADEDGKWMLKLKTFSAGGPFEVYINDIILRNVMIGEVWICSGQSNMQMPLSQSEGSKTEIQNVANPNLRLFYVARDNSDEPNRDCYGKWVECTPESAETFSAVAYYFGKEINNELNVPVGLIHVSWGGSSAQAWINYNILQSTPEGKFYIEHYKEKIDKTSPGILPRDHQSPASLYNGMLKPLIPYGIAGAIWYQGEANTNEHQMYKNLMETMIDNWRDEWGQGDFPFYYVQLAPFNYDKEIIGAALRDAQRRALDIPNTGMAVIMDIGNPKDIHPTNKKDVGHRLSLWALANTYRKDGLVYSGPLYKSMKVEGKKIRIYFDHIGGGLVCKGEKLSHFTIAGNDRIFHPAEAFIEKNTILVSSKEVKNPIAVRFAFNNGDEPNLFNREGLPASTFRTDNWKISTETAMISSEYNSVIEKFLVKVEEKPGWEIRYTLDGKEPTNLSEKYFKPITIAGDATIKAKVFVDGEPSILTSDAKIEKHLATGKKISYKNKYHEQYTAGGEFALVNSLFGSTNFKDGNWQGFFGKDMEVVIDLGKPMNIEEVKLNCLQVVDSWIVLPKQVEVYIPDDGEKFTKVAALDHEVPAALTEEFVHEFDSKFKTVETRFIKVIAKNYGPLPEWHQSAGSDSWLFVDEIVVK